MKKRVLIALVCVMLTFLSSCGKTTAVEPESLSLSDFVSESGVVEFPLCRSGSSKADFEKNFNVTYEEYTKIIATEIISALESKKRVPECSVIFEMYGFRCYGVPLGFEKGDKATGFAVYFIDDGQNEAQWQSMSQELMFDANVFLESKGGAYSSSYVSLDGNTTVYYNHEPLPKSYEANKKTASGENGVDTYVNFFILYYAE